jgi:hypothetical protein
MKEDLTVKWLRRVMMEFVMEMLTVIILLSVFVTFYWNMTVTLTNTISIIYHNIFYSGDFNSRIISMLWVTQNQHILAMLVLLKWCLCVQVLYSQTLRLCRDRLDDHIHVDEYRPGKCLSISYWR